MKTKTKDNTIISSNKTNIIAEVSAGGWGVSCRIIEDGNSIYLTDEEIVQLIALLKEAAAEIKALQKKVKQKK